MSDEYAGRRMKWGEAGFTGTIESSHRDEHGRMWFDGIHDLGAPVKIWQDECEVLPINAEPGGMNLVDPDPALAGLRAVADAISARAREIKPLDLVSLLSGGPTMVVEEMPGGAAAGFTHARCWWLDHDGDLHVANIPVALLRVVP